MEPELLKTSVHTLSNVCLRSHRADGRAVPSPRGLQSCPGVWRGAEDGGRSVLGGGRSELQDDASGAERRPAAAAGPDAPPAGGHDGTPGDGAADPALPGRRPTLRTGPETGRPVDRPSASLCFPVF